MLERDRALLNSILTEIIQATEAWSDGSLLEDELPTAAGLARKLNLRLDNVKKKLRLLKDEGLIRAISVSPKRYRFDRYTFKHLDEDSPLYELLEDISLTVEA